MGILESLTKNPSLIALAALGIGLFIFRDKISGFFSDITGGAQGAAQIAETGGLLARNLQSNLTFTPLPEDPIFGESGIFSSIGNFFQGAFESISKFTIPSFPSAAAELPIVETEQPVDFTDVGMAEARSRQDIEAIASQPIARIPESGNIIRDLIEIPFAVANIEETQAEFQERSQAFAQAFPDITRSTSLTDDITFGRQLSRESEDFDRVLAEEAARSESIFAALFGNVQNPNF